MTLAFWKQRLIHQKNGSQGFNRFDHGEVRSQDNVHLTLGSVRGAGKFLQSGDQPQQDWLRRSMGQLESQGEPTKREFWDGNGTISPV